MSNNFSASVSLAVLEGRLTAARAGYLDNLSGGAVALASVMNATRGGYLDNLSGGAVALDSKMDIVDTSVDTLLTRLTSARGGYLDNLSAGAVALDSKVDTVDTNVDTLLSRLSSARGGYLDNLSGGAVALASVMTATRGGYLDNLDAPFQNIQKGTVTIAASAASGFVNITSVDLTKTMLLYMGSDADSTGMAAAYDLGRLLLYDAGTVYAYRQHAPGHLLNLNFMAIEWK